MSENKTNTGEIVESLEAEEKKMNFKNSLLIGGVALCSSIFGAFLYSTYANTSTPPYFVTISVTKVIESQAKSIDSEMIKNNSILTDSQVQAKVEEYTEKISTSLMDYSKKNKIVVFEKSAIISDGIGIKDITDEFIKAIK